MVHFAQSLQAHDKKCRQPSQVESTNMSIFVNSGKIFPLLKSFSGSPRPLD